jgi:hypothetical protein
MTINFPRRCCRVLRLRRRAAGRARSGSAERSRRTSPGAHRAEGGIFPPETPCGLST